MNKPALIQNVADEEQVTKAKKDLKLVQEQETADLRYVLESRQGRNVLWRILGFTQMGDVGYDDIAMRMAKKAGMRMVGVQILAAIEAVDFSAYQKMQREAKEKFK